MTASARIFRRIRDTQPFNGESVLKRGVWTIGFGTTAYNSKRPVRRGDTCDRAQAELWLARDVANIEKLVNQWIRIPLTQLQFDALVWYAYHEGMPLTLRQALNSGDLSAAEELMQRKGYSFRGIYEGFAINETLDA